MKKLIRNSINIQLIIVMAICSLNSKFIQAQDKSYHSIPVYSALDYGVINDGITMNTEKIQQLIDKVADLGGGTVYFPPGKYLTGTLFLKSYINLHIESPAPLLHLRAVNQIPGCALSVKEHDFSVFSPVGQDMKEDRS